MRRASSFFALDPQPTIASQPLLSPHPLIDPGCLVIVSPVRPEIVIPADSPCDIMREALCVWEGGETRNEIKEKRSEKKLSSNEFTVFFSALLFLFRLLCFFFPFFLVVGRLLEVGVPPPAMAPMIALRSA